MKKRQGKKKNVSKPIILLYYRGQAFGCVKTRSFKITEKGAQFGGSLIVAPNKSELDAVTPKHIGIRIGIDSHVITCSKARIESMMLTYHPYPYLKYNLTFITKPSLGLMT